MIIFVVERRRRTSYSRQSVAVEIIYYHESKNFVSKNKFFA